MKTYLLPRNEGFSLIELLIAIVIIGLVAGMLVGVFGSSLTTANINASANKVVDDMRQVNDAAARYYLEKGTKMTALTDLTAAGLINTVPMPPSAMLAGFTATAYVYTFGTGTLDGQPYMGWGDPTLDDSIIYLPGLTEDVCKKINEKFLGSPAADAPPPLPSTDKDIQCWDNQGSTNSVGGHNFTAIKLVYGN